MAAWQVDFYIIPRQALAARGALMSSHLDDEQWWTMHALPADYERRLAAVAPAASPEMATHRTWGPQDGNRVDVWLEGGRVSAVMARVDVRRLDSKFGAALLLFVRSANAILVRSDGLVVEPKIAAYAAALRSAGAWKLANDPASFVAGYSDEDDEG
jgi:hypothetical protein